MLTSYLTQTRNLLQNPSAPTQLYSDVNLTSYINIARGQLAGEAECIRVIGTLSTVIGQQAYNFSSINVGSGAGISGVLHVRRINYLVASGQKQLEPRSWEWFDQFVLNNPAPASSFPSIWAQYAQGAAPPAGGSSASGRLYINVPDQAYTLYCDCVCFPSALAIDADPEPIPYLWTDAVPYFAAYLALLSAQTNARQVDAQRYFAMYSTFVDRARRFSNPSLLRGQYEQASDIAQAAKFGIQPNVGGQGAQQ